MLGIVVTGGQAPSLGIIKNELDDADMIVAADSGLDTLLSYGYEPDLIVGDMDSISNRKILEKFHRSKILLYPEDKDYTDTELAINHLYEKGCTSVVVIGGGGGRLDHLIAIYSLFFRERAPVRWITDNEKIFLVKGSFCINLKINTVISLFPVTGQLCSMTSSGLKWPLDELEWNPGDGGISNVSSERTVKIDMKSGKLVMIIPLDDN
ncbi:thiamine diphosphokinase [Spirochaeta isovalerica]|uniref:Thiamine diphosphokinase n=1 Tax=Spirochaeta isovalerica TaxID=150 RepID=A0A841R7C8_9SPIO|nr:thiamine diphosphokinase [Spirochaeta isovalerica]MBB6479107.1 thiamine pyrophosphokinase [Spirochaeta isovalerica]